MKSVAENKPCLTLNCSYSSSIANASSSTNLPYHTDHFIFKWFCTNLYLSPFRGKHLLWWDMVCMCYCLCLSGCAYNMAHKHLFFDVAFSSVSFFLCCSLHWVNDVPKALSEVSSVFHLMWSNCWLTYLLQLCALCTVCAMCMEVYVDCTFLACA